MEMDKYDLNLFELIYGLQTEIIDSYMRLTGYPKYLDINSLDMIGSDKPSLDNDEQLEQLSFLIKLERIRMNKFKRELPLVYRNYVEQAKKRLEAYDKHSSIGFIRLNNNWKKYLCDMRIVNYENDSYLTSLAKATFTSNLKGDPEQVKIWLFMNPILESSALLLDDYDKAIFNELIGGSCKSCLSEKQFLQFEEEKNELVTNQERILLNNLTDYCKRNSGSSKLYEITVLYLEALMNTRRDFRLLYNHDLRGKLNLIGDLSTSFYGSSKFYKNILEPLEEKNYIKKHKA